MATNNLTYEQTLRFDQDERWRLGIEPRCHYDPRDHGFTPVGKFQCPRCGVWSYWPETSED